MHPRTIKLAADGALELLIYGEIGLDFFGDGVDAGNIVSLLSAHQDATEVVVRINSPGGSAFDGVAIYNVLKSHPARVTVHVDGLAASAASVVAMAGDTISMASGAMMMIHDARALEGGDASDHERIANILDKLSGQMAEVYAARAAGKTSVTKLRQMMADETWLTAREAVAAGLADDVTKNMAIAAHFDARAYGYRNAPKRLTASSANGPLPVPAGTFPTNSPPADAAGSDQPEAPRASGDLHMKIVAKQLGLNPEASEDVIAEALGKFQAKAKADADYRASVAAIVGEEGDAALGVIKASLEAAEQLPALQAKVEKIEAEADAEKRKSLIKRGKDEGKLTDKLIAFYADRSTAEFEAFLAVASKVVPVNEGHIQPKPAGAAADDGEEVPKHNDKTFAELSGNERVALKASNPEHYAQMRAHFYASR